ncbi:MAG: prepilin-type N-terminal cleavage/methylation domain-containing protein [Candidatus Methylopumilus sp.]|jgi:general secretion pathway protein G
MLPGNETVAQPQKNGRLIRGFTLIELMVVMTVIALLISIAVPRYFHSIDNAKEATLKQNLGVMREAIDKFYGDNERYPGSLQELVAKKYIRSVPVDPLTESAETWVIIAPDADASSAVYDIKSGAVGNAKDGSAFSEW